MQVVCDSVSCALHLVKEASESTPPPICTIESPNTGIRNISFRVHMLAKWLTQ